jgi:hypothetical protein
MSIKKTITVDGCKYQIEFKHTPKSLYPRAFNLIVIKDSVVILSSTYKNLERVAFKEAVEKIILETHKKFLKQAQENRNAKLSEKELKEWDGVIQS